MVINFTVLVKGRQYDRTGVMYLGDAEVWRTSTAEPNPSGIRWVWLKDMTPFLSLWKEPQTIIFDLENIVNDIYTGLLNTTLTASFFKAAPLSTAHASAGSDASQQQPPADLIIPITRRLGSAGQPSQFTVPEQEATGTATLPRNVRRAVFTVDVKGQGDEEFWWSNVPQSAVRTFETGYGTYPGYSPWREVQVLIDGRLAGVAWPFPVIYTGGVVPHLHRPVVGVEAFDLRESEIDVTPWLPLLCDGGEHAFTVRIVGLEDDGAAHAALSATTGSSWYVTGKVFLWLDDDPGSITTGSLGDAASANAPPTVAFSQRVAQNATGANETLEYDVAVSRTFSVSSVVRTQRGEGTATWSQQLSYANAGVVYAYGYGNLNVFSIRGSAEAAFSPSPSSSSPPPSSPSSSSSSSSSPPFSASPGYRYSTRYAYPLFCNSTASIAPAGNLTLWAALDQGLDLEVQGDAVFPTGLAAFNVVATKGRGSSLSSSRAPFRGSLLSTWRNSTADYYRPADNSYSRGVGRTHQVFSLSGLAGDSGSKHVGVFAPPPTQLYYRDVSSYNDTIIADHIEVIGKTIRH